MQGNQTKGKGCAMDLISRQAAMDALEKEKPTPFVNKDGSIDPFGAGRQNQWYRDGIAIMNLPTVQPDRSLWFRIGEICVDESKGFITAGRAFEKIRELLREAERRTDD